MEALTLGGVFFFCVPELSSTVCIRAEAAAPMLYSAGSYWSPNHPLRPPLYPLSIINPLHYPPLPFFVPHPPNLKRQSKLIRGVCGERLKEHCLSPFFWVWLCRCGCSWWLRCEWGKKIVRLWISCVKNKKKKRGTLKESLLASAVALLLWDNCLSFLVDDDDDDVFYFSGNVGRVKNEKKS